MENIRLTRKQSVRSNCLECCGDSWKLVKDCLSPKCALYHFRLGTATNRKTINRTKAIRLRCLECVGHNKKDVRECTLKTCKLYRYRLGVEDKIQYKNC